MLRARAQAFRAAERHPALRSHHPMVRMESVLGFLGTVGGAVFLSILLLRYYRRRVPHILSVEDHQLAGHFLGAISGFYGVLLAFTIVTVWGQFQDAKAVVTREANQIGDLYRLARGLPEPAQARIHDALVVYEHIVVTKEWQEMEHQRASPDAWNELDRIWAEYRACQPQTPQEAEFYRLSLTRLADLSDARRLRLLASREKIPAVMWVLLILGAVVLVLFTFLFRFQHARAQLVMTGVIAGLIAFILFLVMDFDRPFGGAVTIPSGVFERELERARAK